MLIEKEGAQQAFPYTKNGNIKALQKYRDLYRLAVCKATTIGVDMVLIGIENQSQIHYAMPIRGMLYDAISYTEQAEALAKKHKHHKDYKNSDEFLSGFCKEDVLIPVITIVVYYGRKVWDGATSLHEMLNLKTGKSELLRYINDYKIAVVCPREMTDTELDQFQTNLKQVFGFLKYDNDKKLLRQFMEKNRNAFSKMDKESCYMIEKFSNIKVLKKDSGKEGGIDMCKAIEDMCKESEDKGKLIGFNEGEKKGKSIGLIEGQIRIVKKLYTEGILTKDQACESLAMTPNEFDALWISDKTNHKQA